MMSNFKVRVHNTGDQTATFYVGASILDSVSSYGCGQYGNVIMNLPIKIVSVGVGQYLSIDFPFSLYPAVPGKTYYAVSKIYSDSQLTKCLDGCRKDFTAVTETEISGTIRCDSVY